MDPSVRPPGGSVVVREAPPSSGGGLMYLARDADGRAHWVRDAILAERHASLREAGRAALLAPSMAGASRPAYAVPMSVAGAPPELQRPERILRLVVSDGEPLAPVHIPAPAAAQEPLGWPFWWMWEPWFVLWRGLLFRRDDAAAQG